MPALHLALFPIAPLFGALWTSSLPAQQVAIACGAPLSTTAGICTGQVAPSDSVQRFTINLRVTGFSDTARTVVRFRATSGVLLPDSISSVSTREVNAVWFRNRGAEPVGIAVEARGREGSALQYIELRPRTAEARTLVMSVENPFSRAGFENAPLRSPMVVEIRQRSGSDTTTSPLVDPEDCKAQRVVFSRYGAVGSVIPDSAIPEIYDDTMRLSNVGNWRPKARGCFARGYLSLGERPGVRQVRTALMPGSGFKTSQTPMVTTVRARANPRFVLGATLQYDGGYLGRDAGTARILHVERLLPDGTKVTFDSTAAGTVSVDSVKTGVTTGVLVGVSSPVFPSVTGLTGTIGVDFNSPRDNWYVGISLLRVTGLSAETLPVDLHLLSHWGRVKVLDHPSNCVNNLGKNPCGTHYDYGPRGIALSLTIDAGTLLADAIKKFGT